MVEYYHYTGDRSYLNVTYRGLISQLGPAHDFNMPSETFDEGNDDQAFWVFGAMSAAEYSFPQPPAPFPSWITIVQNAWESFASRWNSSSCNGGLKWQFHAQNAGWYYKSTISNACFFQLSARLARYTGNNTYLEWAHTIWNWSEGVGLIDDAYNVYDGTDELINCSAVDHHQWSYNVGAFLYGAAMLQNYTNSSQPWLNRTLGLLDSVNTFVTPFQNSTNIIFEAPCELRQTCNTDQLAMKAFLVRWLAGTSMMAPFTAGRVGELLRTSAKGAAAACAGGRYGNSCGSKWYINGWDGTMGLGQQLCALEIMYALLVNQTNPPANAYSVDIHPAPTISVTPTVSPQPSETARPLHDSGGPSSKEVKNKIRGIFAAVVATLALY